MGRAPAIVVLVGPTASGKTALLDQLFGSSQSRLQHNLPEAEVISADSMQAYRGMDIGTAKPDNALLARLPHRLIDIRSVSEQYTVGDFVHLADAASLALAESGKLPIVCGGTGFYIRNFLCGLPTAPGADPGIRAQLAEELRLQGQAALYEELRRLDPESARRIHPNDAYRITRALEILRSTARPLSDFAAPKAARSDFNFCVLGIERPRTELNGRIDSRVDAMMDAGLAAEFDTLRSLGFGHDDPGMQAIGYREFWEAKIEGRAAASPKRQPDFQTVADAIKLHSRQYAKRQMTFFRALPGIRWIHPDAGLLARNISQFLGGQGIAQAADPRYSPIPQ